MLPLDWIHPMAFLLYQSKSYNVPACYQCPLNAYTLLPNCPLKAYNVSACYQMLHKCTWLEATWSECLSPPTIPLFVIKHPHACQQCPLKIKSYLRYISCSNDNQIYVASYSDSAVVQTLLASELAEAILISAQHSPNLPLRCVSS